MARLNEPPVAPQPSADTVDAVKRRFLRQNRELAKTNSQQSIRIRNLENDCSRLLAENLSLREQVLQLQNAFEAHSNRPSFVDIDAVKSQLEAKIQELGSLVGELGQLKKPDEKPRCKSQTAATRRSPGERQWRSGLGLQEVENQMMPTIVEDKFYPRRTMGADELQGILDDPDSQSPDIGPPPVSRFENEDPIAFDPNPATEELNEEPAEGEPALSINLETRKKRRESGPKLNIRRVSVFRSPPEESEETTTKTVRAGAKRKFSTHEDEQKVSAATEPFRFSRRNANSTSETGVSNEEPRQSSPERPVLGAKPVNTDPVLSPKKQRSATQEKSGEKKPLPASKTRGRLTITRNVIPSEPPPFEIPDSIATTEINLDCLPPKTPAADNIFSPPSTEPSTSRPETKDTPPPGEINHEDQTGQGGRPSRRARPQVSYKEPSLATKMRRPGKELVAAVYPQQDRRTSVESHNAPSTAKKDTLDSESADGLGWKSVPAREGEEEVEMGSPLRQKLDRREGGQEPKSVTVVEPVKADITQSSNAIAVLIDETKAAKRKPTASTSKTAPGYPELKPASKISVSKPLVKEEDAEKDSLAIFDFTDSSPAEKPSNNRARIADLAKAARNARRHSSVPASSVTEERRVEKADGALPSIHKRTVSGNVKSDRSAGLNKSTSSAKSAREIKIAAATVDLKTKASIAIEDGTTKGNIGSLRAERAASRRKSMIL